MIDEEALHRAADKVWDEVHDPEMTALAQAAADFLNGSTITESGTMTELHFDRKALGYGIMLGYLAAQEEHQSGEAK
jgi:hypothetical protein